jgi:hypothetical protein
MCACANALQTTQEQRQPMNEPLSRTKCPTCGQVIPTDSELRKQQTATDDRVKEQVSHAADWTPEYVLSLMGSGSAYHVTRGIIEAHNAALAAERKELEHSRSVSQSWYEHAVRAEEELAAERGKNKIQSDALKLAYQELDAGREKRRVSKSIKKQYLKPHD